MHKLRKKGQKRGLKIHKSYGYGVSASYVPSRHKWVVVRPDFEPRDFDNWEEANFYAKNAADYAQYSRPYVRGM